VKKHRQGSPERAWAQAIVRAGEAIDGPQREGQRHRKALLRHEHGRRVGQAQIKMLGVPVGWSRTCWLRILFRDLSQSV
jgi:hypothetical protein